MKRLRRWWSLKGCTGNPTGRRHRALECIEDAAPALWRCSDCGFTTWDHSQTAYER